MQLSFCCGLEEGLEASTHFSHSDAPAGAGVSGPADAGDGAVGDGDGEGNAGGSDSGGGDAPEAGPSRTC